MNGSRGFTLVELLVTMAIATLLLGLATQLIQGTNRLSQSSVTTSAGLEHVQQAANIVADEVRRAYRVLAPGSSSNLGSAASGAPTTAGTGLLVLLGPAVPGAGCTTSYELTAYYFVDRSALTSGDQWVSLPADAANDSKRVMLQYRVCTASGSFPTSAPGGGTLRVVTDYLGTGTFTYSGVNNRNVTLTLAASQTVLGKTITGATITTVALARNIY